jgi:hypothetical protein
MCNKSQATRTASSNQRYRRDKNDTKINFTSLFRLMRNKLGERHSWKITCRAMNFQRNLLKTNSTLSQKAKLDSKNLFCAVTSIRSPDFAKSFISFGNELNLFIWIISQRPVRLCDLDDEEFEISSPWMIQNMESTPWYWFFRQRMRPGRYIFFDYFTATLFFPHCWSLLIFSLAFFLSNVFQTINFHGMSFRSEITTEWRDNLDDTGINGVTIKKGGLKNVFHHHSILN